MEDFQTGGMEIDNDEEDRLWMATVRRWQAKVISHDGGEADMNVKSGVDDAFEEDLAAKNDACEETSESHCEKYGGRRGKGLACDWHQWKLFTSRGDHLVPFTTRNSSKLHWWTWKSFRKMRNTHRERGGFHWFNYLMQWKFRGHRLRNKAKEQAGPGN